jgi:hypothetical protein
MKNDDWHFSVACMPATHPIIGAYFLQRFGTQVQVTAGEIDDRERNADILCVLVKNAPQGIWLKDIVKIACRHRRLGCYARHEDEITIRSKALHGGKTEYDKIIEGCGDMFFYADATDRHVIERWLLCDLKKLRSYIAAQPGRFPGRECTNPDGTKFRVVRCREIEARAPGFVLATNWLELPQKPPPVVPAAKRPPQKSLW